MDYLTEDTIYGYSTRDEPSSRVYTFSKQVLFRLSKRAGLFHVARQRTGQGLRVLCYHGFSLEDEHRFRPRLFMQESTFRHRLEFLQRNAFPVLSLDEALDRLEAGTLPAGATVITIDDGFYSVYRLAFPALRKYFFPATIYIATSDFLDGRPVFRIATQYMFWKTRKKSLDPTGLCNGARGPISLTLPDARRRIMWEIVQFGDSLETNDLRSNLASELGLRLGLDYQGIVDRRLFCLMNPKELDELVANGFDVQLHTHNHRLPRDPELARKEIRDNRGVLMPFAQRPLRHFCYPSGIWSDEHWPVLEAAQIRSAMTCLPGFNYPHTPRLAMHRFLDGEDIVQVEFEAELSGYSELLRRAREGFRGRGST